MRKLSFVFLLIVWSSLQAAFDYPDRSASQAATGTAGVAGSEISGSFIINPALTWNASHSLSIGFSYSQLFNMAELAYGNAFATVRSGKYGIGVAIESFGSKIYREETLTLSGSLQWLDGKLIVGLSWKFYYLIVQNYENLSTMGLNLGVRYRITNQLAIGSTVENLNQPRINGRREELPQRMRLGLEYQPAKELYFYADLEKDAYFDPILAVGISYRLSPYLFLRSGYNSSGPLPSLGLGLQIKGVQFEYATQYHFDLGATHIMGIHFIK